jgi:hypothetical protein
VARQRPPIRVVELTLEERRLLRRLIRGYAQTLGYGAKFHDYDHLPGGPHDWPDQLRRANTLIRKLHEHRYAGGLAWPEDGSSQPSTATAPTAKR